MRTLNFTKHLNWVLVFAIAVFFTACNQMEGIDPDVSALEGDSAELFSLSPFGDGFENARTVGTGGNVSCSDIGLGDALTSGRVNYNKETGSFDAPWPQGFSVEVIDNYKVNWTFTPFEDEKGVLQCIANVSVIVKGGNAPANVYDFGSGTTGGTGLIPPNNAGGQQADLSNLTFCYNLEPCDDPCEEVWKGETAWAANGKKPGENRYTNRGNWATYTAYTGVKKTVSLFAGQTNLAGHVTYSAPYKGMVTIKITLNDGWRFKDADENVKIQDYAIAPSGNPAPGQFDHKGNADGNSFSIKVPENKFYGVHVDVEGLVGEKCPCD